MEKTLFIGANIFVVNKFSDVSIDAYNLGANFFQVFLASPQKYNSKRHTKASLLKLKKNIIKYDQKVVVHASYMLNFCNPCYDNKHTCAVKLLKKDLEESIIFNAIGVVVHMGKKLKMTKDEALNNYVLGIKKVLKESPKESTIIFETGAGVGTEICTSMEDLGELYNKFTPDEKNRIKFCIDTCHIFSAGYDIGNEEYVDEYIELVEENLGWNNIICIHLNGSKCKLNSRKDRHEDIGRGEINEKGLKKFIIECYKKDIPIVLETPGDKVSSLEQINKVKKWCK